MARIKVGNQAPDFTLSAQDGHLVSLRDFLDQGAVVLFFYVKNDTPGCISQVCGFRDRYEDFTDAGAAVIGISSDSADSHRAFADRYDLPFTLVADRGGKVRKLYGVPKTLGILDGRVTYVIDSQGTVRHVFNSQLGIGRHITEALATIQDLAG